MKNSSIKFIIIPGEKAKTKFTKKKLNGRLSYKIRIVLTRNPIFV